MVAMSKNRKSQGTECNFLCSFFEKFFPLSRVSQQVCVYRYVMEAVQAGRSTCGRCLHGGTLEEAIAITASYDEFICCQV